MAGPLPGQAAFWISKREWRHYLNSLYAADRQQQEDMDEFVRKIKVEFGQYPENEFGPECP